MGDINTLEYGAWETGFDRGWENAIDLLKIAKELEERGFDSERILQEKLDSLNLNKEKSE